MIFHLESLNLQSLSFKRLTGLIYLIFIDLKLNFFFFVLLHLLFFIIRSICLVR